MIDGLRLDRVTMTGADDETPIKDLVALSKEYPFVEWGILVSPRRVGTERFPGAIWQQALADEIMARPGMKISVHLCGGYVRSVLAHGTLAVQEIPIWGVAGRVQLNFHAEPHDFYPGAFIALLQHWQRQVIFQIDGVNGEAFNVAGIGNVDATPLFDTSGGAGVLPGVWPAATYHKRAAARHEDHEHVAHRRLYHGYAGGLGPETIADELPKIAQAANGARIWIDMEGRVRTAERFDLEKVRAVLDYCAGEITR